MGLTIHYNFQTRIRNGTRVGRLVERMRQRALDLPLERVDDTVTRLSPDICQRPLREFDHQDPHFGLLLSARESVYLPWNPGLSIDCWPLELYVFSTDPGAGSESAKFGLARYPQTVQVEYHVEHDRRYMQQIKRGGWESWEFNSAKWRRSKRCREDPELRFRAETRTIKTKLGGWRWGNFCKTQYASDPDCGGVPNFLRCHLAVVRLLQFILDNLQLPTTIDDEGRYETWRGYSDPQDQQTLGWHPGHFDVRRLAEEVGEWNTLLASLVGTLDDALQAQGAAVRGESPIKHFANFEHLKAAGSNDQQLEQFLRTLRPLAEQSNGESEVG